MEFFKRSLKYLETNNSPIAYSFVIGKEEVVCRVNGSKISLKKCSSPVLDLDDDYYINVGGIPTWAEDKISTISTDMSATGGEGDLSIILTLRNDSAPIIFKYCAVDIFDRERGIITFLGTPDKISKTRAATKWARKYISDTMLPPMDHNHISRFVALGRSIKAK